MRIREQKKYKKDYKKVTQQGKDLDELDTVILTIASGGPLDSKYKDHALHGKPYIDCRECHIEPDWLLIYFIETDCLVLVRTGSHSDLF